MLRPTEILGDDHNYTPWRPLIPSNFIFLLTENMKHENMKHYNTTLDFNYFVYI